MTTDPTGDQMPPVANLDIVETIAGHARFREQFARDRAFYQDLATSKQRPALLWIGCSDSRVVPAQITGADPGDLFEIRNIANTVPPASADDDSVGAAIAYAIGHLHVDHIVVCGHTGCGGVKALSELEGGGLDPHLHRWVDYTRPAHALIEAAGIPQAERLSETERAHVQFQLDNLMTYAIVRDGVAAGKLAIHGWMFDLAHGDLLAYDPETGTWPRLVDKGA